MGISIPLSLIMLGTISLYVPVDFVSRSLVLSGVAVALAGSMIRTHYARRGLRQLDFDRQFVAYAATPGSIDVSLRPDVKIWTRSHVVQSIRTLGFGPGMKICAGLKEEYRLKNALAKVNSTIRWKPSVLDILPLGLLAVFAIDIPFDMDMSSLGVVAASILTVTFILIGVQTGMGLKYNRRLSRLESELADWTRHLINDSVVNTPYGYRRQEFFAAQPWFETETI